METGKEGIFLIENSVDKEMSCFGKLGRFSFQYKVQLSISLVTRPTRMRQSRISFLTSSPPPSFLYLYETGVFDLSQPGIELELFLHQSPECWGYRDEPPCSAPFLGYRVPSQVLTLVCQELYQLNYLLRLFHIRLSRFPYKGHRGKDGGDSER